ncbi:MAG: hypothetical protein KDK78_09075, partial [Chlamydiia bacterium]|nr:hypothetical protein [Chlamydiia bacterium]
EGLGRRTFRAWRKEIYSQVASTIKKSVKTWAAGRGLRMYARDELTHGHRRTQSIKLPYRIERNRSTAQFDNKSSLS